MDSLAGQTVSHYVFLEKLGAGGMGEIYKARDSRLNRIVAVKALSPGRTGDPERRRRFIQEAQAASALNHPNIITIHDILPEGDTQYMVMEFVAGKTLHDIVSAGRIPVAQVLQIATQMANALSVAHQAGIIHRDFKPANVMVTATGLVKILDFGLAKLTLPIAEADEMNTLTAAPLTREGTILGTVNYMSPEQAEGLKVDGRSDIFSFGAVLYELLTGQRAFDGDSGILTLSAVLRDEAKPIHQLAPHVPNDLVDLVNRCLRKNPAARWQSMSEVEVELTNLKRRADSGIFDTAPVAPVYSPPVPPPSSTGSQNTARPAKLVLLGLACVALVGLAIATARWTSRPKRPVVTDQPAVQRADASQPLTAPVETPAAQPAPEPVIPPAESAEPKKTPPAAPTLAPAPPPPGATALGHSPISPAPLPAVVPAPSSTPAPAPPAVRPVVPPVRAAAPAVLLPVRLSDGLPFRIVLVDDVPIDAQIGQPLRFRVLDGVKSGNATVIAKGSIVTGSLVDLGGKRKFLGERSKVTFRLLVADSVDDAKINVRATPGPKPGGVESRPFETPKAVKDKDVIASSGTEYVAYISGDQTVSVHQSPASH